MSHDKETPRKATVINDVPSRVKRAWPARLWPRGRPQMGAVGDGNTAAATALGGFAHSSAFLLRNRFTPYVFTLLAVVALGLMLLQYGGLAQAQESGTIMHPENDTGAVATFSAVDPEGKDVTLSVAAADTSFTADDGVVADDAADAAHFKIDKDTGVLTFAIGDDDGPPDFEMPRGTAISDTNTNTYKVVIAASDGTGDTAQTAYHAVTVEVENLDEAATTTIELSSLQPRASVEIEVAYVDGVGNPFLDSTGAANAAIVDPDGSEADTTATTIPADDVEWQWSRSTSRTGTFTDIEDAESASYTPDSGDVNRYLRLTATYEDGQGEGKTLTATSAYTVLASRSANSAPAFQDDFDTTTDGNQDPAAMLDDGATAGDNVGDPITASDAQNDRLTYSFDTTSPTPDADVFQIDRATGQVTVGLGKTVSPAGDTDEPDSVTKQATFTVTVKATDSHNVSDTATLTITMEEEDEAPVFTAGKASHEHEENTDATTAVYTFAAYDPEAATVTYELGGADMSKFTLTGGALTFNASPNFEAPGSADSNNVYRLTVKASDASTPAKSTTINVTVEVTNVDEAGMVSLSASAPRIGVEIRANTPVDPDGGVTAVTWQWQIADAADGPFADIKGATMAGYTPVAADDGKFIQAEASYTDNEGSGKTATGTPAAPNVAVAKVRNLAPEFAEADDDDDDTPGIQITRAVAENSAEDTAVTDPDADDPAAAAPVVATDTADADGTDDNSIFYSLSGADATSFKIDSGTGQISVGANTKLDHETKDTYTVTLTARDPEGLSSSVTVTIEVTDVNEPPEIMLQGIGQTNQAPTFPSATTDRSVNENVAVGTDIGPPVSATDPNGDALTYTLEGTDAASFTIDRASGQLKTAVLLDRATKSSYTVVVRAADRGRLSATTTVTITVTSATNQPPAVPVPNGYAEDR